jgi:hypothetical protein
LADLFQGDCSIVVVGKDVWQSLMKLMKLNIETYADFKNQVSPL